MPITIIAMIVVGLLSIFWPIPKMDDKPVPPVHGNFAPDILTVAMGTETFRSGGVIGSFTAEATVQLSTDPAKNVPAHDL